MHWLSRKSLLRRDPFIVALLGLIAAFFAFIVVGTIRGWPEEEEGFWLVLGASIAVVTFICERLDSTVSRRIKIQLEFFDRWQKLKSGIDELEGTKCSGEAAISFRRYFELLSLEHLMGHHIGPRVWADWDEFRTTEFKDPTVYVDKTFSEWWDHTKARIGNESFRESMEKWRSEA